MLKPDQSCAAVESSSMDDSGLFEDISVNDGGGYEERLIFAPSMRVENQATNIIITCLNCGRIWICQRTNGKASPLFPEPIAEDFGAPLWVLSSSFYALIDTEGKLALFSAYLVDLNGGSQPKLIENLLRENKSYSNG